MRFKLVYSTTTRKGDFAPEGIVAIQDTFNSYREIWFANNDDYSIRKGIMHFYEQDAFDDPFLPKDYVKSMMDQLPKEDLSFKEVKEID